MNLTRRTLPLIAAAALLLLLLGIAGAARAEECDLYYEGECYDLVPQHIYLYNVVVIRNNVETECLEFWDTWLQSRRSNPFGSNLMPLRGSNPNLKLYKQMHAPFLLGEVWDWDFDPLEQAGTISTLYTVKIYERCGGIWTGDDPPKERHPDFPPRPPYHLEKLTAIEAGQPVMAALEPFEGETHGWTPDGTRAIFMIAYEQDAKAIVEQVAAQR